MQFGFGVSRMREWVIDKAVFRIQKNIEVQLISAQCLMQGGFERYWIFVSMLSVRMLIPCLDWN